MYHVLQDTKLCILLQSVFLMVLIIKGKYVFCEVRTEFLYI
jgi:hypothetical protein